MAWENMTLNEQLSEVAGDVKRAVDSKENFRNNKATRDYSFFYFNKAYDLVLKLQLGDKEYRRREFIDEIYELRDYLWENRHDAQYILRYWQQFERAI